MPSKILELRRKVSGSFNNGDSLSYIRTNWSGIDGKPSVYPPTGHSHSIAQVTGLQGVLDGKAPLSHTHTIAQVTGLQSALDGLKVYKGSLGTTDLNTLNNQSSQGIYYQNSNANATLARNYPTASSGAGVLKVYWSAANSGVVQEYNNYIDGRLYVRAYQGSTWSGWSTMADEIISVSGVTTGTNTDKKVVTENILKAAIEAVSPSGARPASDVAAWAKSGNSSILPASKLGSNSSLESSDKFLTNSQTFRYLSKSDVGLSNVPNVDTTNPANITQSANYRFVTDNEKNTWNGKQNVLGYTPENVANKRTSIRTSGADNTSYVSELGVKTYVDGLITSIPTALSQLYNDVSLTPPSVGQVLTYTTSGFWQNKDKPTYNLGEISETTTYKRVTQSEKDAWNNKWKLIYAGTSSALSKTVSTSITVPNDVYAGKTIAVEIRYGSTSVTSFTNKIIFATVGTSATTGGSKTQTRYITLSEFDGQYLKNISTKCYVTTTETTDNIRFGYYKTLVGSFSGTTIDWTTQATDNTSIFIGKIWVLE